MTRILRFLVSRWTTDLNRTIYHKSRQFDAIVIGIRRRLWISFRIPSGNRYLRKSHRVQHIQQEAFCQD